MSHYLSQRLSELICTPNLYQNQKKTCNLKSLRNLGNPLNSEVIAFNHQKRLIRIGNQSSDSNIGQLLANIIDLVQTYSVSSSQFLIVQLVM